jgi:hypothetical protein
MPASTIFGEKLKYQRRREDTWEREKPKKKKTKEMWERERKNNIFIF